MFFRKDKQIKALKLYITELEKKNDELEKKNDDYDKKIKVLQKKLRSYKKRFVDLQGY